MKQTDYNQTESKVARKEEENKEAEKGKREPGGLASCGMRAF